MPIYAFECAACGHRFDRLQKMADPDPAACPQCAADAVKRQVTAPSFRLAGSGWYETDFKKDGDKKRNLVEGATSGASTSTDSKPGDAKPADSKAADSKPAGSKPAEAKPAAKPAATSSD